MKFRWLRISNLQWKLNSTKKVVSKCRDRRHLVFAAKQTKCIVHRLCRVATKNIRFSFVLCPVVPFDARESQSKENDENTNWVWNSGAAHNSCWPACFAPFRRIFESLCWFLCLVLFSSIILFYLSLALVLVILAFRCSRSRSIRI